MKPSRTDTPSIERPEPSDGRLSRRELVRGGAAALAGGLVAGVSCYSRGSLVSADRRRS